MRRSLHVRLASLAPPRLRPGGRRLQVERTQRFWEEWSARCTYHGEWEEPVKTSLIALKGLTCAPTDGIVAAPTASLPEAIGGVRNFEPDPEAAATPRGYSWSG